MCHNKLNMDSMKIINNREDLRDRCILIIYLSEFESKIKKY